MKKSNTKLRKKNNKHKKNKNTSKSTPKTRTDTRSQKKAKPCKWDKKCEQVPKKRSKKAKQNEQKRTKQLENAKQNAQFSIYLCRVHWLMDHITTCLLFTIRGRLGYEGLDPTWLTRWDKPHVLWKFLTAARASTVAAESPEFRSWALAFAAHTPLASDLLAPWVSQSLPVTAFLRIADLASSFVLTLSRSFALCSQSLPVLLIRD